MMSFKDFLIEQSSKDVKRELEKRGWFVDRVTGSHHIMKHPDRPDVISLPHPKKELQSGIVHKIMKTANNTASVPMFTLRN